MLPRLSLQVALWCCAALSPIGLLGCGSNLSHGSPHRAASPAATRAEAGREAYLDELVARAKALRLHEQVMWHRLLHYRTNLLGGHVSEADGMGFFMAPDGKSNPEAELEATIRSFWGPMPKTPKNWSGPPLQHPYCRFPARLAWLNQQLHFDFDRLGKRPCPRFEEFLDQLNPESVTLVFSSYYLNNPASAFGHTFLRINKKPSAGQERQQLLDYGIDFSATVDTGNAILYAFKGLTGLFPGVFRKLPYYYKVREYNDYESRDIWEYELNLTRNEVDLLVAHIWEVGSTFYAYYYLSENCSYHILGTIEVASPRLQLLDNVGWPVLPTDTIKALYANPGLVRRVEFRPSNRRRFSARVEALNDVQKDALAELTSDPDAAFTAELSRQERAEVLDAALDFADARYAKEIVMGEDTYGARYKQRLLERRAELLVVSADQKVEVEESEAPHHGHASWRLTLGEGYASGLGAYFGLSARLALHDLADPAAGYPENIQLEFLPVDLRYYIEERSPWLEDGSLVKIVSLTPMHRFEYTPSWRFRVGATTFRDDGCNSQACLAAVAELGGGAAVSFFDDGLIGYALLDIQLMGLGPIEGGIADLPLRAGIGPAGGMRLRITDDLVMLGTGQWLYLPTQTPWHTWLLEQTLRWQYSHNFALDLRAKQQPNGYSAQGSSVLYF